MSCAAAAIPVSGRNAGCTTRRGTGAARLCVAAQDAVGRAASYLRGSAGKTYAESDAWQTGGGGGSATTLCNPRPRPHGIDNVPALASQEGDNGHSSGAFAGHLPGPGRARAAR